MSDSLQYSLNFPNLFQQQTADTFFAMRRSISKSSLINFLWYALQEQIQTIDQIQKGYDDILKADGYDISSFLTKLKDRIQQQLSELNKKYYQLSLQRRLFQADLTYLKIHKRNVLNEGKLKQREIEKKINVCQIQLNYTIEEMGICSNQSNNIQKIINLINFVTQKMDLIRAKLITQSNDQYGLAPLQTRDFKKRLYKLKKLKDLQKLKKSTSMNDMRVISDKRKCKQCSGSTQNKFLRLRSPKKKQSSIEITIRERTIKSLKKNK